MEVKEIFMSYKDFFNADIKRYGEKGANRYVKKLLKYFRKAQSSKNLFISRYYRLRYRLLCNKHGIEISSKTKIGKGLYIGHAYNITINEKAEIGENCNIHKGIVIGQTNRGEKKGVPKIGNSVWIGINTAIVGNINIGDDVLIAPNSFVNTDVPSHSVVFGNPCIIKSKENATENYINNKA